MLPTKFWYIWPSGFRGEEFKKSANQKEELPMAAMFVYGSERNEHIEDLPNLVGSTYGRLCIKFPQSRMKGEQHRLRPLSL
jgi:hypothetical protein